MKHTAAIASNDDTLRGVLRQWLEERAAWDVVLESRTDNGLLSQLSDLVPDLAFVCTGSDGVSALDLTRAIPEIDVVLMASSERLACEAFEAGALDLILLPLDESRLDLTLARFHRLHAPKGPTNHTQPAAVGAPPCSRIVVWDGPHGQILACDEIVWIEAVGNYVKIHTRERSWYLRQNIGSLSDRLDPNRFMRIHRSTIVNIDRVEELLPASHSDLLVRLECGRTLKMSRFYRKQIDGIIGKL